jgi:hypothetical protein
LPWLGGPLYVKLGEPERDPLDAEETPGQVTRGCHGILITLNGGLHDAHDAGPVDLVGALQAQRPGFLQARLAGGDGDVADLVHSAATGPAEHLQHLVRADLVNTLCRNGIPGPSREPSAWRN